MHARPAITLYRDEMLSIIYIVSFIIITNIVLYECPYKIISQANPTPLLNELDNHPLVPNSLSLSLPPSLSLFCISHTQWPSQSHVCSCSVHGCGTREDS